MCYGYFILTQDATKELNQNDDDMSCVNRVTCITETSFFTQDRGIDITGEFVHTVENPIVILKRNGHMHPWPISKTTWPQYSTQQLNGNICNKIMCTTTFGEVLLLT